MKRIIASHLADRSDEERFRFSLTCGACDREWSSTPIRFSKARENPPTRAKQIIAQTLYQREHDRAQACACTEAVHHFNICPLCRRLVCNYCFIICDDLDLCRSCAAELEESGEAVMETPLLGACSG